MSLAPPGAGFDPSKREPSPPVLLSKTCQNCFMLKIRCDRTQRSDICDRCARLGKHCVFRPARRRDNSAKRDSRIQALEQQVQDLLRTKNPGPIVQQPLPEPSASATSSTSSVAPEAPSNGDVIDEDVLSAERADTLVEMYKSDMMPHFPFVVLAPHITGRMLRYDKPFLFVAILSVSCFHDYKCQEKLVHRFKYLVSDKVLMGGDDSLSLEYLQGLMVVLAWNHYHKGSKFYSQYLQLAISIAVDMRLDRKPIRAKPVNPGSKRNPLWDQPGTQWVAEEQRAAAGLFYLSSTISRLLDKTNTFACNHFIEEGCLTLRQRAEFRADKDIYHVIRLQRIIERIDALSSQSYSDADAHAAYVDIFRELEDFRAFIVSEGSDSHFLFMQYHTAKLFLYQVAYFERSLQQNSVLHLNTLCEGLEAAKAFFDLYLWLPARSEQNLTNSEWIQLSFGTTLAAKLAVVSKDPSVEPQTRELRHQMNIDNAFRHLVLRIGALIGRAEDGTRRKDIFAHYENRVRKIQNWYERMCRATGSDSPPNRNTNVHQMPTQGSQDPNQLLSQPHTIPPNQPQNMPPPAYSQPSAMAYSNGPISTTPLAGVGMTSMSPAQYTTGYSAIPTIAFGDLMTAPGWDMPFTIPMDDSAWMFDPTAGYPGVNMANQASPPSDGTWGSPVAL